jgi:hypothetical protein
MALVFWLCKMTQGVALGFVICTRSASLSDCLKNQAIFIKFGSTPKKLATYLKLTVF